MELKSNIIKNTFKNNWMFFILMTQPLLDIVAFFTFNKNITIISFTIRSLYLLIIITYGFFTVKNRGSYFKFIVPWIMFSALHILNSIRTSGVFIFDDVRYITIVMQMPFIAITVIFLAFEDDSITKQIQKGIVCAFIIIFISVIISLITHTGKTTYYGYGLNGWFTSPNAQSMILSTITPVSLYISLKKNIYYLLVSSMAFILLFFNGTRACFYTLILTLILFLYILFVDKKIRIRKCAIIITICFLLITPILSKYSTAYTREKDIQKNTKQYIFDKDKINDKNYALKVLNKSPLTKQMVSDLGFEWTYNNMKENISAYNLSDNRLVKRMYAKYIYQNSDFITKLVGFNHSEIESYGKDLENDLTAIFYYYGYIGTSLFIIYLIFCFKHAFLLIFKKPKILLDSRFIVFGYTILIAIAGSEYSGALLRKPNANIYISVIIALFYIYTAKIISKSTIDDVQIK